MRLRVLNSKLHRATVTEADLNYVGSISIDAALMEQASIHSFEQVAVLNINNGARFETYAMPGTSGQICLNGAAARCVQPGDIIIVLTFADVEATEVSEHQPTVLIMNEHNEVADVIDEPVAVAERLAS